MKELIKKYFAVKALSPAGFIQRGFEIQAILLILGLLGGRDYIGVIFGTVFTGVDGNGGLPAKILGATYGLAYFAGVFIAPVLLLGGVFFGLLLRLKKQ